MKFSSPNNHLRVLNLLANIMLQGYFTYIIMEDSPTPIAELEHGPSKLDEFLEKNQKKLIILALLIFLGVIAYVFMTGLEKKTATEAGSAFMQATDEESLNKVIIDYSNSSTAGTAAIAIAQLRTNEDKVAALNHFIATYPDHPGIPTKLLELSLIQMNDGKNSDAEITLNKLMANGNAAYLMPRAKIALADIAVSNNEIEKAEQLYTEAKEASSNFSGVADERLLYLKAKEPVLVQKAPTAPAPSSESSITPALEIPAAPTIPEVPATPITPAIPEVPNE